MMIECPKCHAENKDDSKFCNNCATPLGAGGGAGPEAAYLTKTLEILVRVLESGALIAGKYRMRLSRNQHCEWGTKPHSAKLIEASDENLWAEKLRTESFLAGSAKRPCRG